MTRTATKFLSPLLSCVALGSDTQGTHKEQNLLFVHYAREWKLEHDVRKNRSIKPKIRWKAKKSPGVWQGQHQALEVQQALISLTQEIVFYHKYSKTRKQSVSGFFLFSESIAAQKGEIESLNAKIHAHYPTYKGWRTSLSVFSLMAFDLQAFLINAYVTISIVFISKYHYRMWHNRCR